MLSQKYKDSFLKNPKYKPLKNIIETVISKEEEWNISCLDWSNEQAEMFLKDLHVTSPNSISRALSLLRNFVKYIGEKENILYPAYKLEPGRIYELVDYKKLLSTTLSKDEYEFIKSKLINVRDRVIMILAWLFLSVKEIKFLKQSDLDIDKRIINAGTRKILIEEEDIEDIKKCLEETEYRIEAKDKRIKEMSYRNSEYLIKPINVGESGTFKEEAFISNPSIALKNAIMQSNIELSNINLSDISIESIKRSKVIYLLSQGVNKKKVAEILGAGNIESQLFWLDRLARMKYGISHKPQTAKTVEKITIEKKTIEKTIEKTNKLSEVLKEFDVFINEILNKITTLQELDMSKCETKFLKLINDYNSNVRTQD